MIRSVVPPVGRLFATPEEAHAEMRLSDQSTAFNASVPCSPVAVSAGWRLAACLQRTVTACRCSFGVAARRSLGDFAALISNGAPRDADLTWRCRWRARTSSG